MRRPYHEAADPEARWGLSIEASWDGEVLRRFLLQRRGRLRIGPRASCEILVPEALIPRPRTLLELEQRGTRYRLHLPPGALVQEAACVDRDAYRQPGWRTAEAGPQSYPLDVPLDVRVGPWRLELRPMAIQPAVAASPFFAGSGPLAAFSASLLLHVVVVALALSTPPRKLVLAGPVEQPSTSELACWIGCARADTARCVLRPVLWSRFVLDRFGPKRPIGAWDVVGAQSCSGWPIRLQRTPSSTERDQKMNSARPKRWLCGTLPQ